MIALLLAGTLPTHAQSAGEVWESAGPVSTSAGMTAVATDPTTPSVIWLGSATSVWVSEDDGKTFDLVLQFSRVAGPARELETDPAEDTPTSPGAFDDTEEIDFENGLDGSTDDSGVDLDLDLNVDLDDDAGTPTSPTVDVEDTDTDAGDEVVRNGVVRMRVIGELVYVCTTQGLYTIERTARRIGTDQEIRFGRKIGVNDVAVTPDQRVWIATDAGLIELSKEGIGRPARGLEEDLVVNALAISEGRLVAATARGLRIASATADGFDRLANGGRDESGLVDVLVEPGARILTVGASQVSRILMPLGGVPTVDETWTVPGAGRLANGRGDARWAVGSKGAWRMLPGQPFERVSEGLFDLRLGDAATGYGDAAALWSVGRSGAWRLVKDTGGAYSSAVDRLAKTALKDLPTSSEVVRWAIDALPTTLERIDGWALEERLAWLLPKVELRWRWDRRRREDFIGVPFLDSRVLDAIGVRPVGDDFSVMAYWDLMPAITAALEPSRPIYEQARIRARRQLDRVRAVVLPLYQTWTRKRIELVSTDPTNVRAALKEILTIQRLESDLHVYTEGRFPIEDASSKKPAKTAN